MGVLTNIGRAAMAKAIKEQSMFLGLGTGSPEWGDVPPDENIDATALISEVGRRALARCLYVTPDEENGTIEVPATVTSGENGSTVVDIQKYAMSETPTRHLYVEFNLDFADAVGAEIRELGLWIGAALKDNVPPGKMFFTSEDFKENGMLFQVEHREPLLRKAQTRDSFMWVISI